MSGISLCCGLGHPCKSCNHCFLNSRDNRAQKNGALLEDQHESIVDDSCGLWPIPAYRTESREILAPLFCKHQCAVVWASTGQPRRCTKGKPSALTQIGLHRSLNNFAGIHADVSNLLGYRIMLGEPLECSMRFRLIPRQKQPPRSSA